MDYQTILKAFVSALYMLVSNCVPYKERVTKIPQLKGASMRTPLSIDPSPESHKNVGFVMAISPLPSEELSFSFNTTGIEVANAGKGRLTSPINNYLGFPDAPNQDIFVSFQSFEEALKLVDWMKVYVVCSIFVLSILGGFLLWVLSVAFSDIGGNASFAEEEASESQDFIGVVHDDRIIGMAANFINHSSPGSGSSTMEPTESLSRPGSSYSEKSTSGGGTSRTKSSDSHYLTNSNNWNSCKSSHHLNTKYIVENIEDYLDPCESSLIMKEPKVYNTDSGSQRRLVSIINPEVLISSAKVLFDDFGSNKENLIASLPNINRRSVRGRSSTPYGSVRRPISNQSVTVSFTGIMMDHLPLSNSDAYIIDLSSCGSEIEGKESDSFENNGMEDNNNPEGVRTDLTGLDSLPCSLQNLTIAKKVVFTSTTDADLSMSTHDQKFQLRKTITEILENESADHFTRYFSIEDEVSEEIEAVMNRVERDIQLLLELNPKEKTRYILSEIEMLIDKTNDWERKERLLRKLRFLFSTEFNGDDSGILLLTETYSSTINQNFNQIVRKLAGLNTKCCQALLLFIGDYLTFAIGDELSIEQFCDCLETMFSLVGNQSDTKVDSLSKTLRLIVCALDAKMLGATFLKHLEKLIKQPKLDVARNTIALQCIRDYLMFNKQSIVAELLEHPSDNKSKTCGFVLVHNFQLLIQDIGKPPFHEYLLLTGTKCCRGCTIIDESIELYLVVLEIFLNNSIISPSIQFELLTTYLAEIHYRLDGFAGKSLPPPILPQLQISYKVKRVKAI